MARAAWAGIVLWPNRTGVAARGAPEPIRANRIFPRAAASAISSTMQRITSTPASMLPAAPSKVTWNCWKIATVKVSKRTIANAPNSASRCTPISSPPPRIASRSCGSTTRTNTPTESEPSARADSSTAGSSRRSVAATGRYMNGKYDSVVIRTPAHSPCRDGMTPTHA